MKVGWSSLLKREDRMSDINVNTILRERKSSGVRTTMSAVLHDRTATSRSHGFAKLAR